jgi:two-component system sensor histidine kinase SenX3
LADAERLHRTVDQVLRAGAVSQRPSPAVRAPVDLAALARECVDLALTRHHLQSDAIVFESHDVGPLVVRGDAEELRTVVTNLLDNAVKYSGDSVHVTVAVAAPSPDTVWVRVQDRGVGIPRPQLKRIFRRFYRVQTRGLKQVKGTGLGLYIVRSIARAHGGRIFAQSEGEGRGATFTFELPRAPLSRDSGFRISESDSRMPSGESRIPNPEPRARP